MRLIQADLLKLRRRRGMVAISTGLPLLAVILYYAIARHPHFDDVAGVLGLLASVPAAIIGATAGGADIESGVFRDLAATGRSRTALFLARVPAAWVLVLGSLAGSLALAIALGRPTASDAARESASVLIIGALVSAVSVGLAALTGSRGPVMGLVLTFQLGVAPLLAQLDLLGDARLAIPTVAASRLENADGIVAQLPLAGAIAILLAWAAAGLGSGLWRTRTQEI
jgi:hypothetical protein